MERNEAKSGRQPEEQLCTNGACAICLNAVVSRAAWLALVRDEQKPIRPLSGRARLEFRSMALAPPTRHPIVLGQADGCGEGEEALCSCPPSGPFHSTDCHAAGVQARGITSGGSTVQREASEFGGLRASTKRG